MKMFFLMVVVLFNVFFAFIGGITLVGSVKDRDGSVPINIAVVATNIASAISIALLMF